MDGCYIRITKSHHHLMKLVSWESETTGFHTSNVMASTHCWFQTNTALCPFQKACSIGLEFSHPMLGVSLALLCMEVPADQILMHLLNDDSHTVVQGTWGNMRFLGNCQPDNWGLKGYLKHPSVTISILGYQNCSENCSPTWHLFKAICYFYFTAARSSLFQKIANPVIWFAKIIFI